MNKLPLTICIITNRADERFVAALTSAQVAEHVLIIDNKSGNDWVALKMKYAFEILELAEKITDFSAVRNQALDYVQKEWVLFLDSDEVIELDSLPELSQIIGESTADGVGIRRSDVFYGKKLEYGEAGNQPLVRLGRKNKVRFIGSVHETAEVTGTTQMSSISILHYSHPTLSEFITKVSIYAEQIAETKTLPFWKLVFQMCVYPPTKFFFSLIIQGGIQDGWQGVVYAACMSLHSLLVRIYIYEHQFLKSTQGV